MQSFQRALASLSIVVASGFLLGCGGPGRPMPGGSDPAAEAANAALAPEGGPGTPEPGTTEPGTTEQAADAEAPATEAEPKAADEPAPEDSKPASPPEPEN